MADKEELKKACWRACYHDGDIDKVRKLLESGGGIDDIGGVVPLEAALRGEHFPLAKFLVEAGAAVTEDSLFSAVNFHMAEAVKMLLDRGADPNSTHPELTTGETALHIAACRGSGDQAIECMRLLLEAGANPNVHAKNRVGTPTWGGAYVVGETPLHLAAAYGDLEMITMLLDAGADPAWESPSR